MALPGIVVDAPWVTSCRAEVVLADVRWYLDGRSGPEAFAGGHLPGAVYVDLDRDLAQHGAPTAGRHPLPDPVAFAAAMGGLGIGDDSIVVAYDDSGGGTAGRLVWMLRSLGRQAALLDGGLASWTEPLETGPGRTPIPTAFTATPWPDDWFVSTDVVADHALNGPSMVIDARGPDRYRGETEPVDPKAGHIPGARNLPWASLLDPSTGRFRTPAALRERFIAEGIDDASRVIASCGSGVSACADLVALEHAGLGRGRLFVASWSGWSSDPDRPVARGADPV